MTTPNCQDVCGIVHQAALDMGLDIDGAAADGHEPIMKAMDKMFAFLRANKEAFREALGIEELEGGQK